jgi:hypothetical protein
MRTQYDKSIDEELDFEPRVLRPIYHNHSVDDFIEDGGLADHYDGGFTHMVRDNDYSLRSYIDELEDISLSGENLEYIQRIPKRKKRVD